MKTIHDKKSIRVLQVLQTLLMGSVLNYKEYRRMFGGGANVRRAYNRDIQTIRDAGFTLHRQEHRNGTVDYSLRFKVLTF